MDTQKKNKKNSPVREPLDHEMTSCSWLDLKTGSIAISVQRHMEAYCVCVCELRVKRKQCNGRECSGIQATALLNSILMKPSLPI